MHLASSLSRAFVVTSAAAVSLGTLVLLREVTASGTANDAPAIPTAIPTSSADSRHGAGTPVRAMPRLPGVGDDIRAIADDRDPGEVHGLASIEDPSEFAMLITISGRSYLRLSTLEIPSAKGTPRMVRDGEVTAVIADVSERALPTEFASWRGREVLVDGTCAARVIGFAEVSRAHGNPEGTWSEEDGDDSKYTSAEWTVESLREANVTLVAKLDGCRGTWARASEHSPAVVIARVEDADVEREAADALLATRAGDRDAELDPRQQQWQESGGEGAWQDAVTITTEAFEHPETGERWVFARALNDGMCGEPYVATMAAYRIDVADRLHHVTDLELVHGSIQQVVDLDGNGEPEIVTGGEGAATLFDLKSESHDTIYTPSYEYEGCGC